MADSPNSNEEYDYQSDYDSNSDIDYEELARLLENPQPEEFEEIEVELVQRRIAVTNYEDLRDELERLLEINPEWEDKIFVLRIKYKLRSDNSLIRITVETPEERRLQNVRLRDMINNLETEENRLEEMYGDMTDIDGNELNRNNLIDATLVEVLGDFRGGFEAVKIIEIDNKLYSVFYYNTRQKCLIDSVYNYLNLKKTDKLFKNIKYSKLSFTEIKSLIKKHFNLDVKISQDEKTLEYDFKNKKENEILLFAVDSHVGYLKEGIDESVFCERKNLKSYKTRIESLNNSYKLLDEIMIVSYDCEYEYLEGVPQEPNLIVARFFILNVIDKTFTFKSFRNFVTYLEETVLKYKKETYCYAHNASKVETIFIVKELVRRKNYEELTFQNILGNMIKSYCNSFCYTTINRRTKEKFKHHIKVHYFDTVNYVAGTLEEISKSFNLNTCKGHASWLENFTEEDKNSWYLNKKWDYKNKDDIEYTTNDVNIVFEFLLEFNKNLLKTHLKYLENLYDDVEKIKTDKDELIERKYMKTENKSNVFLLSKPSLSGINRNILLSKHYRLLNTPYHAALYKLHYYGGRSEAFKIGTFNNVIGKDINSAYPYVMNKLGVAGKILYFGYDISIDDFYENIKKFKKGEKYLWSSVMLLKYKEDFKFPLIPVYKNGKLIFPNIKNYTIVNLWNFEYEAIKDKIKIKKCYTFSVFRKIYIEEIEELYEIKKSAKDSVLRKCAKLNLNTLYGVSGMDNYRVQKKLLKEEKIKEVFRNHNSINVYEGFEDFKWVNYHQYCSLDSIFQMASSITARARFYLWENINKLYLMGCTILYCDTDSIYFLDSCGNYENNKFVGKELGDWDEERYKEMRIFTIKAYSLDEKPYFKGINKNDLKNINIEDIKPNATFKVKGNKVTKKLEIKIYEINKKFSLNYNKGVVDKDGNVTPLNI